MTNRERVLSANERIDALLCIEDSEPKTGFVTCLVYYSACC